MNLKLTPKHLEVLVKLGVNNKPVKYTEFLTNLNPVLDLMERNYINKVDESYELSSKGINYFNNVLQCASRYLEDKMNSN